jgi:hypothetical protein
MQFLRPQLHVPLLDGSKLTVLVILLRSADRVRWEHVVHTVVVLPSMPQAVDLLTKLECLSANELCDMKVPRAVHTTCVYTAQARACTR